MATTNERDKEGELRNANENDDHIDGRRNPMVPRWEHDGLNI
jgi:hypothetical protein